MPADAPLLDMLRTAAALLGGYLAGSLPVSAWVARGAGAEPRPSDRRDPGAMGVWRLAGPGPGLLALVGEVARGVVPVALALVTFGWWTAWVAAVGAIAGAAWPAFGRRAGGHGLATLAGACLPLAPLSGVVGVAVAVVVAVGGRIAGRDAAAPAAVAGFAVFLALAVVEVADVTRLAGLGLLLLGAGLWAARGPGTARDGTR
jgi:glycerol-3-phosphate acyltransferase PlsY